MRSIGAPEKPEEEAGDRPSDPGEDFVDVEYKVRKKPLLHRLFRSLDPERKAQKGKVVLLTISRESVEWGCGVEYEVRKRYVRKPELPPEAVHVTGQKGVYCFVDMLPDYPEYADPSAERDEDGNFRGPHNYFDAFGYFKWFVDQRIKRGYEALGRLEKVKAPIDWRTIGIAAVALLVFAVVAMQFLGGSRWGGSRRSRRGWKRPSTRT